MKKLSQSWKQQKPRSNVVLPSSIYKKRYLGRIQVPVPKASSGDKCTPSGKKDTHDRRSDQTKNGNHKENESNQVRSFGVFFVNFYCFHLHKIQSI